ncbi:hypothetical protein [Sphingomonas quercus]|uniref:DUF1844 domain-containing protein n=1 Tax=Sphingomonas quercus TaxID=2842451 RepID=A0ABS6BLR1_9SPHN|nr:hypothetical protein [Sphingomonas quercus]MBU3078547.1 hypothetical protein [Sphingomonas quercus]
MTDKPNIDGDQADEDEPFDVQAARHTAYIHAVAQIAATGAFQAIRALHRRGMMDAEDLAPLHETVSLLRDALCPALLDADREMFEALIAEIPR